MFLASLYMYTQSYRNWIGLYCWSLHHCLTVIENWLRLSTFIKEIDDEDDDDNDDDDDDITECVSSWNE